MFVVYKFALHGQQFSCQTGKGNRVKHRQFSQGMAVWMMGIASSSLFVTETSTKKKVEETGVG